MSGIIGKKIGMTGIFDENGKNIPCTIVEAGPCIVTPVSYTHLDVYKRQLIFRVKGTIFRSTLL